jgi:hypothetical protein
MMKKRFTKWSERYKCYVVTSEDSFIGYYDSCESIYGGDAIDRLAELEDKFEQGTLIELPCKVGDTIYVIDEWWEHTEGKPVHYVVLSEDKVDSFTYYGNIIHIDCEISDSFYIFGDDAFLTREEAEAKLKELQE